MSKTKKILGICLGVFGVAWGLFIIARSLKTGEESSAESSFVMRCIDDFFGLFGISNPFSEHLIRKMGHFTEYAILSLIVCLSIRILQKKYAVGYGVGGAFLLALADEFIFQRITGGRGPSFTDVLIDTAGAAVSALTFWFIIFIKERKKLSKMLDK